MLEVEQYKCIVGDDWSLVSCGVRKPSKQGGKRDGGYTTVPHYLSYQLSVPNM
jgi:hypothetical protein